MGDYENEKEIANLDKRMSVLEENDKVQDSRLKEHGQQIDTILLANAKQDSNQELMKKDIESTKRTVEKIDDKVDTIIQKPLITFDKLKNVLLGLVIGFLFTALVRGLFPHIGG